MKAKQFDDGLYATVEIMTHGRKRDLVQKLIKALDPDAATTALLNGARIVAGEELDEPLRSRAKTIVEAFLAADVRSKPIGFYTWSEELRRIFRHDRLLRFSKMASRACAVGTAARTYSSPFRARDGGYAHRAERERAAATAARLREEIFEPVGHAQWVFTVPKMLRPYFLRNRDLLGDLCRAAWQTVREMMVAAAGEPIRPGMVAVVQTFGSKVNFHPHVHSIVSRGGWTEAGQWVPVASVDPHAAALVFRHKVLSLLRDKELIDQDRIALLLSWKHSGFSVHNSVVVQPEDSSAIERLVRYVMRSPESLDRLGLDHETAEARLEPKAGADDGADADQVERLDGDELVARVIVQIPDPKRHLIRSYGRYANAARAKRKRDAVEGGVSSGASGIAGSALPAAEPMANEPDSAERKAARKRWANLIRRIYEVDPLVCSNCGGPMKIVAFITERKVIHAILASTRKSAAPASPAGSRPPPPAARPAGDAGA